MRSITKDGLADHLQELGVVAGDDLVVHSNLLALGKLEGGLDAVFECVMEVIGPGATLAVPTYRIEAAASEVYDAATSPSVNLGAFSEYVRQSPKAKRTASPIHSHAFLGGLADKAARRAELCSFGKGSDFEFLVENGFKCLFLGCDFENAGTLVFHAQAISGAIPYRKWETAIRTIKTEKGPKSVQFPYFTRTNREIRETRYPIQKRLLEAGLLRRAALPYGESMAFEIADVTTFMVQLFNDDPLICVPDDLKDLVGK